MLAGIGFGVTSPFKINYPRQVLNATTMEQERIHRGENPLDMHREENPLDMSCVSISKERFSLDQSLIRKTDHSTQELRRIAARIVPEKASGKGQSLMIVQHNISAINMKSRSGIEKGGIESKMDKLSTGQRIQRVGDDAAQNAIFEKMRSQINPSASNQPNSPLPTLKKTDSNLVSNPSLLPGQATTDSSQDATLSRKSNQVLSIDPETMEMISKGIKQLETRTGIDPESGSNSSSDSNSGVTSSSGSQTEFPTGSTPGSTSGSTGPSTSTSPSQGAGTALEHIPQKEPLMTMIRNAAEYALLVNDMFLKGPDMSRSSVVLEQSISIAIGNEMAIIMTLILSPLMTLGQQFKDLAETWKTYRILGITVSSTLVGSIWGTQTLSYEPIVTKKNKRQIQAQLWALATDGPSIHQSPIGMIERKYSDLFEVKTESMDAYVHKISQIKRHATVVQSDSNTTCLVTVRDPIQWPVAMKASCQSPPLASGPGTWQTFGAEADFFKKRPLDNDGSFYAATIPVFGTSTYAISNQSGKEEHVELSVRYRIECCGRKP